MPMVGGFFHEYVLLPMLAESLNMSGTRTVPVLVLVRTGTHVLVCGPFTYGYRNHIGMWAFRCPTCMSQELNLRSSHFWGGRGILLPHT